MGWTVGESRAGSLGRDSRKRITWHRSVWQSHSVNISLKVSNTTCNIFTLVKIRPKVTITTFFTFLWVSHVVGRMCSIHVPNMTPALTNTAGIKDER